MEKEKMILKMIDASWILAETVGKPPLKKGCNCITCINKRKLLLKSSER